MALIQPKQVLARFSRAVNTYPGMVQPKQCGALGPAELSVTLLDYYETPNGSVQHFGTPFASGTTPPVVTYTGTLVLPYPVGVDIIAAGNRGVATFKTSLDNFATYVEAVPQLTAATYNIPGTPPVTVNFPVGAYAANNLYKGVCSPLIDLGPGGRNFSNGTSGQRPEIILAGNLNGLFTTRFDGVAQRLLGSSSLATAVYGGTDNPFMLTFLARINAVPSSGQHTMVAACHSSDANIPLVDFKMTATAYSLNRRATAGNTKSGTSVTVPSVGPHLFVVGFDGSTVWMRDNGVYILGGDSGKAAADVALGAATTFNQVSLGARAISSGTDSFCSMDFVGLYYHDAPLTNLAEIEMWENYFLAA